MKNISVKPWKIVSTPEAPMSLTETTAISFLYLKTMTLPKYPIIISSSHLSYVKEMLWGAIDSSLRQKMGEVEGKLAQTCGRIPGKTNGTVI